jgi:ABC-type dipeptide/oligopeptide/nickel transport system permease subunit
MNYRYNIHPALYIGGFAVLFSFIFGFPVGTLIGLAIGIGISKKKIKICKNITFY